LILRLFFFFFLWLGFDLLRLKSLLVHMQNQKWQLFFNIIDNRTGHALIFKTPQGWFMEQKEDKLFPELDALLQSFKGLCYARTKPNQSTITIVPNNTKQTPLDCNRFKLCIGTATDVRRVLWRATTPIVDWRRRCRVTARHYRDAGSGQRTAGAAAARATAVGAAGAPIAARHRRADAARASIADACRANANACTTYNNNNNSACTTNNNTYNTYNNNNNNNASRRSALAAIAAAPHTTGRRRRSLVAAAAASSRRYASSRRFILSLRFSLVIVVDFVNCSQFYRSRTKFANSATTIKRRHTPYNRLSTR
jgi:hypothetical protein